ncbi:MAG: hypothetical protein COS68_07035 [Elusimicrobia bacterium CG06_land_8_20_14_3_00_38_11]|nr:MAG: hypothetical protein COS68_07035 [Elusimicrobia bacterium CG06_land_8_20_14_3_00_38_11]
MNYKKTFGPVIILFTFLAITVLLFYFKNNFVGMFALFFILIIISAALISELLTTDLIALLVSLTGLIGMSFIDGVERFFLLGEIAAVWGFVWIIHLLNDREKYRKAENKNKLSDMAAEIEKTKKEFVANKIKLEKISLRISQYKNLTSATKEIAKTDNLQELKEKLKDITKRLLKCDNVRLTTFLPTDDSPPDIFDAWVVQKQSPLLIANTMRDYRFDYSSIPKSIKSVIAVPIFHNKNIIGIIRTDSQDENRFLQEDMVVVSILVSMAEMTVENISLLEKTRDLSIIDGLTGVYVRKFFDERLHQEIARASRFKTPLCVLLSDIDHFKKFNDTYGHQQGDKALKRFSQVLKNNCREMDIVTRYGGEEFAIIMPETSKSECLKIAENIRNNFRDELINGQHITVSIGISAYPDDATEHSQLIRKSDERLYIAKSTGRDKVVWKD